MTQLTFDKTLAQSLYQSNEPFPVDLDAAWQWLGYSNKQRAEEKLKFNFEENVDYFLPKGIKSLTGGRPRNCIMLSIDCFKSLCMMAGTEQGKVIRKYFLECERIAKATTVTKAPTSLKLIDTSRLDALTKRQIELRADLVQFESLVNATKNELQKIREERVIVAKAFAVEHPEVVKYSVEISEILSAYGDGNKYFCNPLKK